MASRAVATSAMVLYKPAEIHGPEHRPTRIEKTPAILTRVGFKGEFAA